MLHQVNSITTRRSGSISTHSSYVRIWNMIVDSWGKISIISLFFIFTVHKPCCARLPSCILSRVDVMEISLYITVTLNFGYDFRFA